MKQSLSCNMKTVKVALLLFLLSYTSTGWPTHTVCKSNHLEIYYRSCDPLQDFAFTLDNCDRLTIDTVNLRAATVLRHSIRELFITVSLNLNGKSVPLLSKHLCEQNHPNFSFCGKKKGEYIDYEGPVSFGIHDIPQGNFEVTAELFNEDRNTIICTNFTILSH